MLARVRHLSKQILTKPLLASRVSYRSLAVSSSSRSLSSQPSSKLKNSNDKFVRKSIFSDHNNDSFLLKKILNARRGSNSVPVTSEELKLALSLCYQSSSREAESDLPFWIFNKLKNSNSLTMEIYELMMKICLKQLNSLEAINIMETFETSSSSLYSSLSSSPSSSSSSSSSLKISSSFIHDFLALLNRNHQNDDIFNKLKVYYGKYRNVKELTFPAQFYISYAMALCHRRDPSALEVLKDMTVGANHEPSPSLCIPLLNSALFYKDYGLLRVIGSWYSKNFIGEKLEFGQINRMLQIASAANDTQLSLLAFQVSEDDIVLVLLIDCLFLRLLSLLLLLSRSVLSFLFLCCFDSLLFGVSYVVAVSLSSLCLSLCVSFFLFLFL
jgi:hypothetical protein